MTADACTQIGVMSVKRLRPEAVMPVRGSEGAAGFDLAAVEASTVPAGGKGLIKTGLSIAIPEGTYARIAARSGLAVKKMINTGAGVVDYDYRGEVCVVLFNHGSEDFQVAAGDRVAQLILERISTVGCLEVETLPSTARGAGGFGSTGVSGAAAPAAPAAAAPAGEPQPAPADDGAMRVKRIRDTASLPVRGSADAAGFDLAAAEATVVKAGEKAMVKTGLSVAIPWGTYARIAPRSGLAVKKMIQVGAGVVDYDYRGEVCVVLFNHGSEDFEVAVGDRVAQLVLEQISMAPCVEVDTLDDTARGAAGWGSTGVKDALPQTAEPAVKKPRVAGENGSTAEAAGIAELRKQIELLRSEVAALAGTAAARHGA